MNTEWKDPAWTYTDEDDDTRVRDACQKLYEAITRLIDAEEDYEKALRLTQSIMGREQAIETMRRYFSELRR